jgi:protein O-mannosyl-transferase
MTQTRQTRRESRRARAGIVQKPANFSSKDLNYSFRTGWKLLCFCVLLTIVTTGIYAPVAHHPFVTYDDTGYVSENPHIQGGLTVKTVIWAMTTTREANWHPLTWLSHALDCQLFGLDAGSHHLTSVIIHTLNVLLLFLLLWRATLAVGRSAAVAALFALHPVNVESVAWIAERKNVLSMFFFLLALAAYGKYVLRPSWKLYISLVLFFVMGLASKPMVITLPFVLLLLDYWPLRRIQGWTATSATFPVEQMPMSHLILEKVPLLFLSAASAVVTIIVQRAGNAMDPLRDLSMGARLENAIYSYAMYLMNLLWPVHLAVLYPHPLRSLTLLQVACALILLAGLTVVGWKQRFSRPYALVGWLWFLGTLVPVIGIIQVGAQGMADRYAYLPELGIFLVAVWGSADFIEKRFPPLAATAVAIIALAGLSVATSRQIRYWRSDGALWSHTLQVTQNNFIANDKMGFVLLGQGRPEALDYFQAAANIWPGDYVSRGEIAASLFDQGKLQEAIQQYETALQDGPDPQSRARYYCNMGVIFRELGDSAQARLSFRAALSTDTQEVQEMVQQLSQWVARQPAAPNYWRLGLLLEGVDEFARAKAAYERSLEIDPQFISARVALQTLEVTQRLGPS